MLTFYLELLKKSALQFRQVLTPWRFWVWVVGVIGAVVVWLVPPHYQEEYLPVKVPVWTLPVALLVVAICVVFRVNYDECEQPKRELADLRAELANAQRTEREKAAQFVARLRDLQKEGLDLRKEMKKTFRSDLHKQMIKDWQAQVLGAVEWEAPKYRNRLLMPPPSRPPMRNASESDLAIMDIEEWLHKLEGVIADLDNAGA